MHFTTEVVPHNYTNHNFITIYYRVWGTTGDYYHRTCEKDATDTTYFISGGGHGQYFQNDTDYEVHLRWGDRGNGSGPTVPSTQELVAYPQNRRWRDIGTTDLFDENFGVITQIVGRDSLDVYSQGTGVTANINQINFANGLFSYLDPNNIGRPIASLSVPQILPHALDGQVARWDSSTGYWEASAAPEGTASVNELIANGVGPFDFPGTNPGEEDISADTWFSISRRLREADRGRLLLTDARLSQGLNDTRSPFSPVLVDYLIDLPRTPWPGPNADITATDPFVQLHGSNDSESHSSIQGNWNLFYTGSVVTDLTAGRHGLTRHLRGHQYHRD